MSEPAHFSGRDAVGHVVEAQARGMIAKAESHAHEIPGHLSAATDAARDTGLLVALLWLLLDNFAIAQSQRWQLSLLFGICWLVWRAGRSGWLGWSRLERLHRILWEEKWEIEHHRKQEREELKALYAAKGFEGKLLEDVMDVLMADNDRLLRIMVEEELGLSLAIQEHPLQQALGAAVGSGVSLAVSVAAVMTGVLWGPPIAAVVIGAVASMLAAHYEHNNLIAAAVWNVALVILPMACLYFILPYLS